MFDLIGKYLGSFLFGASPECGQGDRPCVAEAAAAPNAKPVQRRRQEVYSVAAPMLFRAAGCGILHRRTGGIIVVASTYEQALTLCDTLNLACGDLPSRRFLDAVHQRDAPL